MTPEEILTAMGRNLASDSSADAYIKWQLLSGIRSKVDAKLSPKLVAIYRFAPAPLTRPGLDPADKKQLDRGLRGMGEKDVSRINSELQARVDEVEKANAPILAYRDDLYARLPASGDAILGGLEDAAARAGRGIDGGSHMKGVLAQITTWCVSASPSEIKAVGALLRGLVGKMNPPGKNAKAAFPPNYYAAAEYDSKAKRLTWKDGAAKFPDVKAINALIQQLDEVAASLANMKGK